MANILGNAKNALFVRPNTFRLGNVGNPRFAMALKPLK
jgi:hypothetical protein